MKKRIAIGMAALLALCMAAGVAAEGGYPGAAYFDEYYEHDTANAAGRVRVKGDTAIRVRPDAGASVMERAYAGSELEYMGKTQYDGGGAAWYCVYCYGYLGWIPAERCTLQLPGQG